MYSNVVFATDGDGHPLRSNRNARVAAGATMDGSLSQSLAVFGKKELE